jgi:hypothetical protein
MLVAEAIGYIERRRTDTSASFGTLRGSSLSNLDSDTGILPIAGIYLTFQLEPATSPKMRPYAMYTLQGWFGSMPDLPVPPPATLPNEHAQGSCEQAKNADETDFPPLQRTQSREIVTHFPDERAQRSPMSKVFDACAKGNRFVIFWSSMLLNLLPQFKKMAQSKLLDVCGYKRVVLCRLPLVDELASQEDGPESSHHEVCPRAFECPRTCWTIKPQSS